MGRQALQLRMQALIVTGTDVFWPFLSIKENVFPTLNLVNSCVTKVCIKNLNLAGKIVFRHLKNHQNDKNALSIFKRILFKIILHP